MQHKGLAEALTRDGTRGVSEMRMSERMQTAVGIAYDKYMVAEAKQALGGIEREQLGMALAVGGAAGIVARSGARGALGPAGTGAAMYELTRKYQSFDDFVKICGEARTQGDLDRAARYVGKLTGELAAEGALGIAGAAAGMVAPAAARKADELFTRGVAGIRDTFGEMPGFGRAVLAGGPDVGGAAGRVERSADDLYVQSKSAEEVGRAQQINETVGTPRKDELVHDGWYTRAEFRNKVHNASWSDNGGKHLEAKTEEQARIISMNGKRPAAQYLPELKRKVVTLEKEAIWGAMRSGLFQKKLDGETIYFYHKFDQAIGYNLGKRTQWMRAELTSIQGTPTYHGHPTSIQEVRKRFPHVKE